MKRLDPKLRPLAAGTLCTVLGVLSAMSFVVSGEGYIGRSDPPASATSYLWCALAVCFAMLYWQAHRRGARAGAWTVVFGLIFGVVNTLGGMLYAYDSWTMLRSPLTLALTLARCMGQALPMMAVFALLHGWLCRGGLTRAGVLEEVDCFPRLGRLYRRQPTLCCMLALILCWSPYLIAFFPGTVCWDLGEMAAQFFGLREMDTWHPVFLTWVFGGLISLSRLLGSDNLGAALYTLLQTVGLSYALAQAMAFLKERGMSRGVRLAAMAFFALTPFFGGYAQFISKDTLYVSALLLFSLRAAQAILLREQDKKPDAVLCAGLFGWGLLSCLLRSNGLYVVLPTALLLIVFAGRKWVDMALAAAVGCALLFSHVLVPALGIKDETASGLYSVCFQQSARVLRDHGDTVTPEEYAELDRVLDGENLPKLYEPWISDPVKYTFKFYGQGAAKEKEALARYMTTWRTHLMRYPLSYAEAFFAGNISYYAFTPKFKGESYNDQGGNRLVFETYELGPDPKHVHTSQIEALSGVRTLLAIFARGWRHIPLLSLLYSCAAYTWLLVGVGLSLARRRRWRRLLAFVPALMSLGVCMLSPVNDYFRYFLPIVTMTVPLLSLGDVPTSPQKSDSPIEVTGRG